MWGRVNIGAHRRPLWRARCWRIDTHRAAGFSARPLDIDNNARWFSLPKQIITCAVTKIALNDGENVPAEIVDAEKFVSTSERAEYCSVKRMKDSVKLKLRTPSKLYTLKIEPLKAEEIIKKLQCEIREI